MTIQGRVNVTMWSAESGNMEFGLNFEAPTPEEAIQMQVRIGKSLRTELSKAGFKPKVSNFDKGRDDKQSKAPGTVVLIDKLLILNFAKGKKGTERRNQLKERKVKGLTFHPQDATDEWRKPLTPDGSPHWSFPADRIAEIADLIADFEMPKEVKDLLSKHPDVGTRKGNDDQYKWAWKYYLLLAEEFDWCLNETPAGDKDALKAKCAAFAHQSVQWDNEEWLSNFWTPFLKHIGKTEAQAADKVETTVPPDETRLLEYRRAVVQ